MEREMMLEQDLWLRAFIDEALKAMDASLQAQEPENKKQAA